MAIKGSLKEASLADVCQLLAMGQKTGCLSVTDRSRFGQVYFERGRITYAHIVNRRDRLGDLLVHDGKLTQAELRAVLDRQAREPDRRLGELLAEAEMVSMEDVTNYVRIQIEEAVYHLFTWSRGSFFFEVDERPEGADVLVSINPESLLLEAARRIDEWSLIEKKIPTLDLLFEVERDRLLAAGVDLNEEQRQLATLLDGTRTVQEIIDATGLGEFDVGKALFGLIQAGFAHRVGRRADAESPRLRESEAAERRNLGVAFSKAGLLEDAVRELERVLELSPGDVAARFHLALVRLRRGEYRAGIVGLKQLVEARGPRYAAFVDMAWALRRLGRPEDALLALEEAERLRPDTPLVPLSRGLVCLDLGDPAAALDELACYRARLPSTASPAPVYFYHAALAAALAGRLEEAATHAADGVGSHPSSALLLLVAGAIAERRDELDDAERYYRLAADESPALAQAQKGLGDVAYRRGLQEEALAHYARATELAPELGDDVYARLGNLHYKRLERERAVECWRRALELNPENQVVRNNLDIVAHAG